ncbi:MAG: hypothetical protein FDX21_07750 [Chlorobium sp.]|nr:MAG: hypothetical protein FDX21_07750 [Chlorobium sp.]
MRPVIKLDWPQENGSQKSYRPHTKANNDLEENLGPYCSYCEVFSSDLEVEHVISQDQDATLAHDWNNFLLACGRCNGKCGKSNKHVDFTTIHFPHLNNTFLSFSYKEGGLITVNPALTGISRTHAENMLNLIGLDKYPGNAKYPTLNQNDSRWKHRRIAWEWAKRYLPEYEADNLTAKQIVDFATQRGFFSVWYTVFANHPPVKQLLIRSFAGTATNCFDSTNSYQPVPRNPESLADPI